MTVLSAGRRPRPWARRTFLAALAAPLLAKAPPKQPVNVNAAGKAELMQLPGIGEKRAETIIKMRERNGPFKTIEELRAIPYLSKKHWEAMKPWVVVDDKKAPGTATATGSPKE